MELSRLVGWMAALGVVLIFVSLPTSLDAQLALGATVVAALGVLYIVGARRVVRQIFIAFASVIVCKYFYWRTMSTLPHLYSIVDWSAGMALFLAEVYSIVLLYLSLIINIDPLDRAPAPIRGDVPMPTVDVFIPTYNEDPELVAYTVAACKGMDYDADRLTIWICDDGGTVQKTTQADPGRRAAAIARADELKRLAAEMGARYVTREQNVMAKAGNLNNALAASESELVVVFDADHAPRRDFLKATVGHFQEDEKLFLVQTPHEFLNHDPIERNIGLGGQIPGEHFMFYKALQKGLDSWNSSYFCGSAAVMRRAAVEENGGFNGRTITEDCESAIDMHAKGWNSRYVERSLVWGLQPETYDTLVVQRSRWCAGMLQILILKNPFLVKGLSMQQKIAYFTAGLYWFYPLMRLTFVFAPLLYIFFNMQIFMASSQEFVAYTAPYMLSVILLQAFLYGRVRRQWMSEVYEYVQSLHIVKAVIGTIMAPTRPTFAVTPKGVVLGEEQMSPLAPPYVLSFLVLAAGMTVALGRIALGEHDALLYIVTGWNALNLMIAAASLGAVVDRREFRLAPRLDVDRPATIEVAGRVVPCLVENVSYRGVLVNLSVALDLPVGAAAELAVPSVSGEATRRARVTVRRKVNESGAVRVGAAFDDADARRFACVAELMCASDQLAQATEARLTRRISITLWTARFAVIAVQQAARGLRLAFVTPPAPEAKVELEHAVATRAAGPAKALQAELERQLAGLAVPAHAPVRAEAPPSAAPGEGAGGLAARAAGLFLAAALGGALSGIAATPASAQHAAPTTPTWTVIYPGEDGGTAAAPADRSAAALLSAGRDRPVARLTIRIPARVAPAPAAPDAVAAAAPAPAARETAAPAALMPQRPAAAAGTPAPAAPAPTARLSASAQLAAAILSAAAEEEAVPAAPAVAAALGVAASTPAPAPIAATAPMPAPLRAAPPPPAPSPAAPTAAPSGAAWAASEPVATVATEPAATAAVAPAAQLATAPAPEDTAAGEPAAPRPGPAAAGQGWTVTLGGGGEPPAAPSRLRRLPVDRHALFLQGEWAERAIAVPLTTAEVAAIDALTVAAMTSVTSLPEATGVHVFVNGQKLGQINTDHTEARVSLFAIPDGLLQPGFNAVTFTARHQHRVYCSLEAGYEVWTQIDPEATGFVMSRGAPEARGVPALVGLAHDPTIWTLDVPADAEEFEVSRAIRFASVFGLFARVPHPRLTVAARTAARPGITLYAGGEIPGRWEAIAGLPGIMVQREAGITRAFKLASLTGLTPDQILSGLEDLAERQEMLGTDAGVGAAARATPRPLTPGTTVTFDELGANSRVFAGRRFSQDVFVDLPSDVVMNGDEKAIVTVWGDYARTLTRTALLKVKVNGAGVTDMPLTGKPLEVLNARPFTVPMAAFHPGRNVVTVEAELPTADDALCAVGRAPVATARFALDGRSSVELPLLGRAGAAPNLSAFWWAAFPYDREAGATRLWIADRGESLSNAARLMLAITLNAQRAEPVAVRFAAPPADATGIAVGPADAMDGAFAAALGAAREPKLRFAGVLGWGGLGSGAPQSLALKPRAENAPGAAAAMSMVQISRRIPEAMPVVGGLFDPTVPPTLTLVATSSEALEGALSGRADWIPFDPRGERFAYRGDTDAAVEAWNEVMFATERPNLSNLRRVLGKRLSNDPPVYVAIALGLIAMLALMLLTIRRNVNHGASA